MNKTALGAIFGTALLGLAKSKGSKSKLRKEVKFSQNWLLEFWSDTDLMPYLNQIKNEISKKIISKQLSMKIIGLHSSGSTDDSVDSFDESSYWLGFDIESIQRHSILEPVDYIEENIGDKLIEIGLEVWHNYLDNISIGERLYDLNIEPITGVSRKEVIMNTETGEEYKPPGTKHPKLRIR